MERDDEKKPKAKTDAEKEVSRGLATVARPDEADKLPVSQSKRWEDSFQRLKAFQKKYGHCAVPFRYPPDVRLGRWVAFQRTLYKKMHEGKTQYISLTPERIRRLEGIGFDWTLKGKRDWEWDVRYAELAKFTQQYHHCQVPTEWEPNPRLATWVSTQRHQERLFREGHDADINQGQIDKLNKLGFLCGDNTQADADDPAPPPRNSGVAHTSLNAGNALPSGLDRDAAIIPQASSFDVVRASLGRPQNLQQHMIPGSLHPALPILPNLASLGATSLINSYQRASAPSGQAGNPIAQATGTRSIMNAPLPLRLGATSSFLRSLDAAYPPCVTSQEQLLQTLREQSLLQGNANIGTSTIPAASPLMLLPLNSGRIMSLVPSTACFVSQALNAPLSLGSATIAARSATVAVDRTSTIWEHSTRDGTARTVDRNDEVDNDSY